MMTVLIVENAPLRLRGRLTLWMMEVAQCVYVTDCNQKMRQWIWDTVRCNIGGGSAILVWATNRHEFGYDVDMIGENGRVMSEVDGIKMIARFRSD